ncbi:MAG TPA: M4 family metallopeptidase, partial [Actinomycetota bacterium]|nr:M4 family metallopeptidase [Actinomycetota bacterium]
AYADYFGNAIDVNNTSPEATSPPSFLAEDLCRVARPKNWTCPLRDLNDGRTVDDYFYELVDFDNGGVHENSTIFSGALWNIREALGGERADLIVYKTLTEFTTPLDEFNDGRNSVLAAADALGATPAEIAAINAAFDEKGIVPGWDARPSTSGSTVLAADVAPLGFFLEMFAPEASGTKYVIGDYADKRDADGEHPLEIYVGDIAGGPLTKVGEDESSDTTSDEAPDISGNKVVWGHVTDQGGGFYDLDVHSRTIGGSVKTVAGGPGLQMNPAIDGKTIVWEDTRSGGEDIWMKRGTNKPVRVAGGRAPQLAPQVSGDWVAWWVPGIPNQLAPSIGVKNVRTGAKFSIKTTNPNTFIGAPVLGPDYLTWYEDPDFDGLGSIRTTKFTGRRVKDLVPETSAQAPVWTSFLTGAFTGPALAANATTIAYTDEFYYAMRDVNEPVEAAQVGRDVWVVPFAGGTPTLVTTDRGDQAYPALGSGSTVIWLDASSGRTDLVRN